MCNLKLTLMLLIMFYQAQSQPQLIVISDIDDTIQDTQMKPGTRTFWGHVVHKAHLVKNIAKSHDAFIGLPGMYQALASNGIEVRYVSGAPKIISGLPEKFLQSSGFPLGELSVRPSLKITTEEFKVQEIARIMAQYPESQFVLVGDNGEKDVTIYNRLYSDPKLGPRINATFIHRLFSEGIGESLHPQQKSYLTAADLAVQMHEQGWLNARQTNQVIVSVDRGLNSRFHSIRRRALPGFVQAQESELRYFRKLSDLLTDTKTQELYLNVLEKIAGRGLSASACFSFYHRN